MTKSFSSKDNDEKDIDFGFGIGWGFTLGLMVFAIYLLINHL